MIHLTSDGPIPAGGAHAEENKMNLTCDCGSDLFKVTDASEVTCVKCRKPAFATVHLARNENATTFHVHGGGLIVGRLVNEFGIARTVTAAIRESLGSAPAS